MAASQAVAGEVGNRVPHPRRRKPVRRPAHRFSQLLSAPRGDRPATASSGKRAARLGGARLRRAPVARARARATTCRRRRRRHGSAALNARLRAHANIVSIRAGRRALSAGRSEGARALCPRRRHAGDHAGGARQRADHAARPHRCASPAAPVRFAGGAVALRRGVGRPARADVRKCRFRPPARRSRALRASHAPAVSATVFFCGESDECPRIPDQCCVRERC